MYTFACLITCSQFPVQKIRSNKLPFRRAYVPEGVLRLPHLRQGRAMASIPPLSRGQKLVGATEHRHGEGFSVCVLPPPGGMLQTPICPAWDQSFSASQLIRFFFLDYLFSSVERSAKAHNLCHFCLQAINSPCLTRSILSLSVW